MGGTICLGKNLYGFALQAPWEEAWALGWLSGQSSGLVHSGALHLPWELLEKPDERELCGWCSLLGGLERGGVWENADWVALIDSGGWGGLGWGGGVDKPGLRVRSCLLQFVIYLYFNASLFFVDIYLFGKLSCFVWVAYRSMCPWPVATPLEKVSVPYLATVLSCLPSCLRRSPAGWTASTLEESVRQQEVMFLKLSYRITVKEPKYQTHNLSCQEVWS